jgi:hypothetical protein
VLAADASVSTRVAAERPGRLDSLSSSAGERGESPGHLTGPCAEVLRF